jgi:hypothetical protein
MEMAISIGLVGKVCLFLLISLFWGVMCLFPNNDQPTSTGQVIFWLTTEVLFFAWLFDFFSIKIIA